MPNVFFSPLLHMESCAHTCTYASHIHAGAKRSKKKKENEKSANFLAEERWRSNYVFEVQQFLAFWTAGTGPSAFSLHWFFLTLRMDWIGLLVNCQDFDKCALFCSKSNNRNKAKGQVCAKWWETRKNSTRCPVCCRRLLIYWFLLQKGHFKWFPEPEFTVEDGV